MQTDAATRPVTRRVADRLRAGDPGRARALLSARAVLAAGLAAGGVAGVLWLAGASLVPAAIAGAAGLFGVVTLPPRPPRAWAPAVAAGIASSAVAAALVGPGLAGPALALGVAVLASWLGRWTAVGRAAGFLGFLTAILVLRIGMVPADVPGLVLAAAVGPLAVLLVVDRLLPDRPAPRARRLARTIGSQLSLLVDAAVVLVADGPGRGRQRRLRRRLVAVQESALQLDLALDELAPMPDDVDDPGADDPGADDPGAGGGTAGLRRALLDVEALADHLTWAVLTVAPGASAAEREALAELLRTGRRRPDPDGHGRTGAPLVPRLTDRDDRLAEVVERLAAAADRLAGAAAVTGGAVAGDPPRVGAPVAVGPTVVRAAVACTAALVLGLLLDRDQWYWSLVGAFIVVTTTTSRGAGVRKAADRAAGTAVGVAAGLGVAMALAGRSTVLVGLLLAVVAAMVWVFRVNYALFMFVLTVAVALLYELLGVLTPAVLGVRLAETALGAAVAAVVVSVVLPVPTRRTVDDAVEALLAALAGVLDRLTATGAVATGDVRAVARAVSALREATEPVAGGLPVGDGGPVRAARLLATALRVRVAALATATSTTTSTATATGADEATAVDGATGLDPAARAAVTVVADRLAALRQHLRGPGRLADDDPATFPDGDGEVVTVLRAIDDRLAGYGTSRGIRLRADPGALAGGTGRRRD